MIWVKGKGDLNLVRIAIKPYHLFQQEGSTYLINIEDMTAIIVDESTAEILHKIKLQPFTIDGRKTLENLKKVGLLSETKKKTSAPEVENPIVNICLFITQSCNLNCVYCYGNGGSYGSEGDMNEETAFQAFDWLLDQSGKMKQVRIGFFGGEPFLKFSLMKSIVEYAKKKAKDAGKIVNFSASSNGTLFEDEVVAFIKEEEISVLVSFDGPKVIQDIQRPYANGIGSYDVIVPKIKKLLKAVPETLGHAVLVGDTNPKIVKDALNKIGFLDVSFSPVSLSLFTDNLNRLERKRDTKQIIQYLEIEAEMWMHSIRNKDVAALKGFVRKSALYEAIISLLHSTKKIHPCGAGLGMVAVSTVGDVYLCHRFVGQKEYILGNIFEARLNRREYLESQTISNAVCSVCFARYHCAGGCKHDNAGACGSIVAPAEDICRIRCRELELAAVVVSSFSEEDKSFLVDNNIFPPKPCPLDF